MEEEPEEIEGFQGVYLLYSKNIKCKGRTYVGYTVNPNRRIKQHNRGRNYGGAGKTSDKGPWEMVLVVHGFPSAVAALRFEWAWQNPHRSRRLKHIFSGNGRTFSTCMRVLWTMLSLPPWNRLPLTLRWLYPDLVQQPPHGLPMHMTIVHGPVALKTSKKSKKTECDPIVLPDCPVCHEHLPEDIAVSCVNAECGKYFHIICLAKTFLNDEEEAGEYIPCAGTCPECNHIMLWGDVIRKKKGFSMTGVVTKALDFD